MKKQSIFKYLRMSSAKFITPAAAVFLVLAGPLAIRAEPPYNGLSHL
jgi:hypothetical protein